ncbi:hypothetical protein FEM33_14790 [Dyadobacter flavalbus]|uniref:Uncharacterized protein n=1 Tax=Dyadobacter flavalbus TaxID=2579942 RepID=A0A5M8QRT1_9BACT|nr:hypothetical protein FEM33_14790 [Dyadobacter flavalbus]
MLIVTGKRFRMPLRGRIYEQNGFCYKQEAALRPGILLRMNALFVAKVLPDYMLPLLKGADVR